MVKKYGHNYSVDLVKILAIFLIVFFHSVYEFTRDNSIRPIGFVGLSLFFIVSGYLLATKYPRQGSFSTSWFLRRYFRIAPIYYLSLISIVILFGTQVYSGNLFKNLIFHFFFLDFIDPNTAYGIISPAWFFVPLIGLYLLYPYLNFSIKKDKYFIFLAFFLMIVVRLVDKTWTSYSFVSPLFFLGEFCFGIAYAYEKKFSSLIVAFSTVIVAPVMFLPYLLFSGILKLKVAPNKLIKLLGASTMVIFLFHESIIKLAVGSWKIYSLSNSVGILVVVLTALFLVFISGKISKYLSFKLK